MRNLILFTIFCLIISCSSEPKRVPFTTVEVLNLHEETLSVRAIELMGNSLAFAANKGTFGTIDLTTNKVRSNIEKYHTSIPEFRSVAHTIEDFFMLSVGNPALLFKTGEGGKMELVYKEEGEGVFYDAITFWNDQEGVAVGDSRNGCLSIIITRDGGATWQKQECSLLPEGIAGEGAFAASNTNIKIVGHNTWVATTKRMLFSPDKGKSWTAYTTPVQSLKDTEGIFSIDFYDDKLGFAMGGDFTKPNDSIANKAITKDGGKTWKLIADGKAPGYKSCVQFVPNSNGKELVTVGFTGISYSNDMGETWTELSKDSFYTIRFKNDTIAYAAGNNRISKLTFR